VLLPGYLANPDAQAETVRFLMAHGANPRRKLPFDPAKTVVTFAASIKSPMVALLDAPPPVVPVPRLAQTPAVGETSRVAGGAKLPRDGASRSLRQARFDPSAPANDTASR
jgi:hypothetical protein